MGDWISPHAAPFAGFDRKTITEHDDPNDKDVRALLKAHKAGQVWPNPMVPWLQQLYNRSNFDFAGIYLTSDPAPSHQRQEYSVSALDVPRGWTIYYDQVAKQGWGTWLIYKTFSDNNQPGVHQGWRKGLKDLKNRAVLHGRQIKSIVGGFQTDSAGAVVYIDNEGGTFPDILAEYYKHLFDEMRTPGPDDLPPVRPGIYAFDDNVTLMFTQHAKFFEDYQDLFIWIATGPHPQPFLDDPDRIAFDLGNRPIWLNSQFPELTLVPVGEQTILNYINFPSRSEGAIPPMAPLDPSPSLLKALPRYWTWDFDSSFVRDPRYPEAEPRFAIAGDVLVRGRFNKEKISMSLSELTVQNQPPAQTGVIRTFTLPELQTDIHFISGDVLIEPEAPLILTESSSLFTLDTTGAIVTSKRTPSGQWTPLTPIPTADDTLRRIRALTAAALDKGVTVVCYISQTNKIYASLRTDKAGFSDPKPLSTEISAYPFSKISSNAGYTSSGAKATNTFFISSSQKIHMFETLPTTTGPPTITSTPLEPSQPSILLPSTPLASIAPSQTHTLVFAISKTLHLTFAIRYESQPWTAPQPLFTGPGDPPLHPHTKLTLLNPAPKTVLVAAFSSAGIPTVYTATLTTTSPGLTALGKPTPYPRFPPAAKALEENRVNVPMLEANQAMVPIATAWNFNSYGDLVLGLQKGAGVTLTVAAAEPGRAGLLRRNLGDEGGRWMLVAEKGDLVEAVAGVGG